MTPPTRQWKPTRFWVSGMKMEVGAMARITIVVEEIFGWWPIPFLFLDSSGISQTQPHPKTDLTISSKLYIEIRSINIVNNSYIVISYQYHNDECNPNSMYEIWGVLSKIIWCCIFSTEKLIHKPRMILVTI